MIKNDLYIINFCDIIKKVNNMNKENYIKIVNEKLQDNSKKIMFDKIERYYEAKEY